MVLRKPSKPSSPEAEAQQAIDDFVDALAAFYVSRRLRGLRNKRRPRTTADKTHEQSGGETRPHSE